MASTPGQGYNQPYVDSIIDRANAGDTGGFTKADWQLVQESAGYETPSARAARAAAAYVPPTPPTPNGPTAVVPTGPTQAQQAAIDAIRGGFAGIGLSGLDGLIDYYITNGFTPDGAMIELRKSDIYKNRFPAMASLIAKGRAITEAQYVAYERNAAQLEAQYGLPKGVLLNNVTRFLEAEKSAEEITEDVKLGVAAAYQAPQWLRDQFNTYFGLDSQAAIFAHFIDPDLAAPELQKMYATTVIGAEAQQRGIDLAKSYAERLQGLGVDQNAARQGFSTVAGLSGLSAGRGDVASQQTLIDAALAGDTAARNDVQRAQASRTGRFAAGGGFIGGQQGVGGLGRASN